MSRQYYVFGMDDEGILRGIPAHMKMHTLVIGATNTGKSTLLKMLALSSLVNREGFMIIDPHGQLADSVIRYIPRDRADDLVYISPKTINRYGYVVKINPLRLTNTPQDPGILLDSIKKIYIEGGYGRWGDRLERILLNSIVLVSSLKNARFSDIYRLLIDKYYREDILRDVEDEELRRFWMEEYEDFDRSAYTAVMNKLQPLLFNKILKPMFDTDRTSINLVELMDSGKIVIVDIPVSILSDTGTRFLGTLIINMVYLSGFKRQNKRPFHIIVDEAYKFLHGYIEDILMELRKYKVYLTLAAHSLLQFDKDSRAIIQSLSHTYAIFRTDQQSARLIAGDLGGIIRPEMITSLPDHYFICVNKGWDVESYDGGPIKFIARTIPDEEIEAEWDVIDPDSALLNSVKRYGEAVGELKEYTEEIQPEIIRGIERPELTPKEYIVLTSLRFRGLNEEESLYAYLKEVAGWRMSTIKSAIDKLYENNYIYRRRIRGKNHYYVSERGDETFFRIEFKSGRTGSDRHREIIRKISHDYMSLGYYTIVDDGSEVGRDKPDIVVFPYIMEGDRINPDIWDYPRAMAVEVVLHDIADKAIRNWAKAVKLGIRNIVIVTDARDKAVVFNEAFRDRERVSRVVKEVFGGVKPEVVDRAREVVIKVISDEELTEEEEGVEEKVGEGGVEEEAAKLVTEEGEVASEISLFPDEEQDLEEFIRSFALELLKKRRHKTVISALRERGLRNVEQVGITYDGRFIVFTDDGKAIVYGTPDENALNKLREYERNGYRVVKKIIGGRCRVYAQKRNKYIYLGMDIPDGAVEKAIELRR